MIRAIPAEQAVQARANDVKVGYAYWWYGQQDFRLIGPIDLGKSDEQIAREFGVYAPKPKDRFFEAAESGDLEGLKRALAEGVDVDARDWANRGALHLAAKGGDLELVRFLVKRGADVNLPGMHGESALAWAAGRSHEKVLLFLIEHQADVNQQDSSQSTPLHDAAERGSERVIELLIAHGADRSQKDQYDNTPYDLYRYRHVKHNPRIEELLKP